MVLDSETVEGRLPTPLLGVGEATTKAQDKKKKAKTDRSRKEELTRHSPVALKDLLTPARIGFSITPCSLLPRHVHGVAETAANVCQSRLAGNLLAQG